MARGLLGGVLSGSVHKSKWRGPLALQLRERAINKAKVHPGFEKVQSTFRGPAESNKQAKSRGPWPIVRAVFGAILGEKGSV